MPTNPNRSFLLLLLAGLILCASPAFAKEKQYRLTLVFSQPDFKWSRVITYRKDFHLFLDAAPFPTVHDVVFVAGVLYPKDGSHYISLAIGTSQLNKESGETLGSVRFLKLPENGKFDIPPIGSPYGTCRAEVEFLP